MELLQPRRSERRFVDDAGTRGNLSFQTERSWEGTEMNDALFIGITVLFFVVSVLYVRFCEKL